MRTVLKSAAALSLAVVLWRTPAQAQTDCQKEALNQVLALRADLLEYLGDVQKGRVHELSQELTRAQRRLKELEVEERQRNDQVTEVDQQLATPELELRARPQIEALKTQLMNEGAEQLRTEQAAMTKWQAELHLQMEREEQRGRMLQEKTRQIQSALAGK